MGPAMNPPGAAPDPDPDLVGPFDMTGQVALVTSGNGGIGAVFGWTLKLLDG